MIAPPILTVARLRTAFKVLAGINLLLLIGTWFVHTSATSLRGIEAAILNQVYLATENVFASWYSSVLLLLSALVSFICFANDQLRFRSLQAHAVSYGWLIFSACFAVLSFDEMGSVHEYIGEFMAFKEAGDVLVGGKDSGWTLFYYLIGAVSLFIILFSLVRIRQASWSLPCLLLGLLFYLSNPIQENYEIDSYRSAKAGWTRPVFSLLLEEGSELFGSLLFLLSTSLYAVFSNKQVQASNYPEVRPSAEAIVVGKKHILYTIFLLGTSLLVISLLFESRKQGYERGVPENWIPSVLAFVLSLYCLSSYQSSTEAKRRTFFWLAILSMLLSIYYGSDAYSYVFDDGMSRRKLLFSSVSLSFAFFCYWKFFSLDRNKLFRLVLIVSLVLLTMSILMLNNFSAELGFLSLCCLGFAIAAIDDPQHVLPGKQGVR